MQLIKPSSSVSLKLQMLLQFVFINLKREKGKTMPSNKNKFFLRFHQKYLSILKFFSNMGAPKKYVYFFSDSVNYKNIFSLYSTDSSPYYFKTCDNNLNIVSRIHHKLVSDILLSKTFFCLRSHHQSKSYC